MIRAKLSLEGYRDRHSTEGIVKAAKAVKRGRQHGLVVAKAANRPARACVRRLRQDRLVEHGPDRSRGHRVAPVRRNGRTGGRAGIQVDRARLGATFRAAGQKGCVGQGTEETRGTEKPRVGIQEVNPAMENIRKLIQYLEGTAMNDLTLESLAKRVEALEKALAPPLACRASDRILSARQGFGSAAGFGSSP